MKKHHKFPSPIFISIAVFVLATLACGILSGGGNGEDASLQQTMDALAITQAAHETLVAGEPVQPTEEIIIEEPAVPTEEVITEELPQPTEEIVLEEPLPTETQALEIPDALLEGISFSFAPEVAQRADAEIVPGEDYGPDAMPGSNYPTHYKFTLQGYPVVDHFHTPTILVYPVDEYRAICPQAAEIIAELEQIIRTGSDAGISEVPFLPMWPAAQIFASNLEFVDFQNGSGVRFLTMYGQDMTPINNQSLFYTFQGLTDDGRYYVSAVLPVTHPELRDDGSIDTWPSFEELQEYITEKSKWLNEQPTTSFNPSLTDLDTMIATILVDRDNEPLG